MGWGDEASSSSTQSPGLSVPPPSYAVSVMTSDVAVHADGQQYPVQLFVYDLSNGLARSLSQQLTGRHFDAIYHTSIVVHAREWYFGQGIFNDVPGNTHFGTPIERINLGTTSIDPDTFREILTDLHERYTAQAYHLLRFNCNTFTNEVANILVGRDIPARITSLPEDFLATPFGRMMGPQIDAMFRGTPSVSARAPSARNAPPSAMGILNSVTQSAVTNGHAQKIAAAIQHIESIAQYEDLKQSAPCSVIMFTSETCPPCVQLHPVYESLAERYTDRTSASFRPIVFGQVEHSARSMQLMTQQAIRSTPTFHFYVHGEKVSERLGASPSSLEDAIEELLWRLHRPHPHAKLPNPASMVPSKALVYKSIPNLMTAEQKLNEIVSQHKARTFDEKADLQEGRAVLTKILLPWIREGMAGSSTKKRQMTETDTIRWSKGAQKCVEVLSARDMFPVVDLVRIAILDEQQAATLAQSEVGVMLLNEICAKVRKDGMDVQVHKATLLTAFRLLGNALAAWDNESEGKKLAKHVAQSADATSLLVFGVLSDEGSVRLAAVNAAFNWARLHGAERGRFIAARDADANVAGGGDDDEVELTCALLECVEKERDLERLHRATAALLVLLYCAPSWHASLYSLLDVTEAPQKLQAKVEALADDVSDKAKDVRMLLDLAVKLSKAT